MKSFNLQWYVDKLKRGEKFSLVRYGDGEMYCMWGKKGENSNGCKYSSELRKALLESMGHKEEDFIYGMQRVLPQDRKRFEAEYPDIEFLDTEIFSDAVANGELFPFIEQLKKMKVVIIGNESIRPIKKFLPYTEFIEVPKSNAFDSEFEFIDCGDNTVYLFSCGMAANAFISKLHGQVNGWLIDIGHIWDPFVGKMSRCDLEGKTLEDIEKNLHDKTQ